MAPAFYPYTNPYTTWQNWTSTGSISTTWHNWTSNTSSTMYVWRDWISTVTPIYTLDSQPAPPLTAEQQVAQAAREERIRLDVAERLKGVKVANDRAQELLLSLLDPKQKEEYETKRFFHVQTREGERTYRITSDGRVQLVKSKGGEQYSYCIHPRDSFPAGDKAAALKLLLETDEREFLRIANATVLGPGHHLARVA